MTILNSGEYNGDIIQSQRFEGCILTNTLYSKNKDDPEWHYHENLHICFVYEKGKVETRRKTIYTKDEESVFFYYPEELHRWVSPSLTSRSANIEIERSFLKKYGLSESDIKNAIETNVSTKAHILKIQHELLNLNPENQLNLQFLLLELVSSDEMKKQLGRPRWVLLLKELLHARWNEALTLNEISRDVGAHPVTISKNFRNYFHCTFGEYRLRLKIEKTIDLIKNTSLPLSQIAFYCGFSDQSHFIRNFKKQTSFLPRDFRKF